MRTTLLAIFTVAVLAAPAAAQEKKSGVGVGAEAFLTGPSGAAVIYDAGAWRIDGILGFYDDGPQDVALGGRFLWVLHDGVASDFSIGAGLGLVNHDEPGPMDNDTTDIHLEGLAQLRAFVVPNVALSAALGLGIVSRDGDDYVDFTGQLIGSVGIAYFFW